MNRARSRSLSQRGGIAGSRDKVSNFVCGCCEARPESGSGIPLLVQNSYPEPDSRIPPGGLRFDLILDGFGKSEDKNLQEN